MIEIRELAGQPLWQSLAWTLLHFVWQGAAIGFVAFLLLRVVRPQQASGRYAIGVATLVLMLATAAVTFTMFVTDAAPIQSAPPVPAVRAPAAPVSPNVTGVVIADLSNSPTARELVAAPGRAPLGSKEGLSPAALFLISLTWVTGVLVLSLRLLGGWMITRRLTRRAVHAVPRAIEAAAARLACQLELRTAVTLLQSGAVQVPTLVGWTRPVILLPAAALAGLSPAHLEAILAHELAHIRRHDFLINLLQSVVETLLFYHPAVWWISAQIREEREHCCDDLAVGLCGDRLVYVSALAELTSVVTQPAFALAATDGSLAARVRRLLGAERRSHEPPPVWTALALLAALIVGAGTFGVTSAAATDANTPGVSGGEQPPRPAPRSNVPFVWDVPPVPPAAPAPPAPPVPWEPQALPAPPSPPAPPIEDEPPVPPAPPVPDPPMNWEWTPAVPPTPPVPPVPAVDPVPPLPPPAAAARRAPQPPRPAAPPPLPAAPMPPPRGTGSNGNLTWSNDGERISLQWHGAFRLSDDERDVEWMEEGATLVVTDGGAAVSRLELRAGREGRIERRYTRNGTAREYEPEGRAFLARILERLVRGTGMFARERVARFLGRGGVDAVLDEIDRLDDSSYVRRVYYVELLKQAPLSEGELSRVLRGAANGISSDYEKASVLVAVMKAPNLTNVHRAIAARAAATVESDYEQRRVLAAALATDAPAPDVSSAVVDAAASVGSDHERGVLLMELARRAAVTPALAPNFFARVREIDSSYEQRRVLSTLAAQDRLDAPLLEAMLRTASSIDSAFERATVLIEIARRHALTGEARELYRAAARAIDSDYESSRALAALDRADRR